MPDSVHLRTPSVTANDSRGLALRHIAYLRTVAGAAAQTLVSRQQYDPAGRLAAQQDPRLPLANTRTVHALNGLPLKVANIDAGRTLNLPGLAGEPLQHWDARGIHRRTRYDLLLRTIAVEENGEANVETFTYADAGHDAGYNLRGQLIGFSDPSGNVSYDSFALALANQPLRDRRTFDDTGAFISQRRFTALGLPLEQIDAAGHRQQSTYDVAGQLVQVRLRLKGQTEWQLVQQLAHYNAAGQIIEQLSGNNVITRWHYDPANGRLLRQTAHKDSGAVVQDIDYEYDPEGNVTATHDHALTPRFFANQRIDGRREFAYDSLYRLARATGHADAPPTDNPGRPQPTDPNDRRNYVETYSYDNGNNLTTTVHVRDGASHTREMFIDPASNRGARWTSGGPPPDFDKLFDAAGNQLTLTPGQDLQWNSRGQLASVTLLRRDSGPDDIERYRYSQNIRVGKRLETHSARAAHYHDVRYLPALEIHTRDSGEILHVILVDIASGSLRCLHWEAGKPPQIEADQLRYSLTDHLQSCVMELDRQARLISREDYLPFGGTALLTAASQVEVGYKTVRYSGKEMDVSGLYEYGRRYYAAWLQRWISSDPAGDVDGLNRYAMVGGNPMRYVDSGGMNKEDTVAREQIAEYSNLLSQVNSELKKLNYQLYNLTRTRDIYKTAGKKLAFSVVSFAAAIKAGAAGATIGGAVGSLAGPAAPVTVPVAGAVGGILAAQAAVMVMDKLGEETTLGYSIMPDPAALSVKSLKARAADKPFTIGTIADTFSLQTSSGIVKTATETTARVIGKHLKVPYLKQALSIARQMAHLTEALNDSWGQGDLDQLGARLNELERFLDGEEASALNNFEVLQDLGPAPVKLVGAAHMPAPAPKDRSALQQDLKVARSAIRQSRNLLGRVSAYLQQKHHAA